jgi:hypothetical protein
LFAGNPRSGIRCGSNGSALAWSLGPQYPEEESSRPKGQIRGRERGGRQTEPHLALAVHGMLNSGGVDVTQSNSLVNSPRVEGTNAEGSPSESDPGLVTVLTSVENFPVPGGKLCYCWISSSIMVTKLGSRA